MSSGTENLVLADLFAWRDVQARRPEILYWRTATGQEVDFMLEAFLDEYAGSADGGLLLYGGAENRRMLCDEIVYISSCSFSIPSFIPFISSWKLDQVQRFLNS